MSDTEIEEDILRALRRITQAIDIHSRKLANTFGLTGPQLVCLRVLGQVESMTPSGLAREVSLSQGTVTGIIDRLAARQLVSRERNPTDRRLVTVAITDAGRALIAQAPSPLQETFTLHLAELSREEQARIRDTLMEIVRMMGGEKIEVEPMLEGDSVTAVASAADELLSRDEGG